MTTVVQHKLVTILNVVDRNYECRPMNTGI